jgi:PAS domain S-box-containing protein
MAFLFTEDHKARSRNYQRFLVASEAAMLREIKTEGELGIFEALADTLPALVRICDATGSSIWFNKEWLTFRGRSADQELGAGWLEGLHPQDAETSLEVLSHRFVERQPYETKYRLLHHSGQYRWLLHRAAPRLNSDGEFLGFITACVDIHDATIADEERRQFFNVASDILLTSNNDGKIDKVSSACERVLGWTAAEMVRSPLSDLVHPDDLAATLATSDLLTRGEELIDFENRYRHKDGSYRWLSWRAHRDEETGTVFASAMDITQRKAFEAELQQIINRYNLAISATSDGIWDWDLATGGMYVSPRYIEMLGFTGQDTAPKSAAEWRSHIHPDDAAIATHACKAYLSGQSSEYRAIFRMKHADGSWRTILSRGIAIRDDAGEPYRMLGVHADITEQKQMEDSLRLLKDQAEAADRAKSDFLANMSHEIRTPMNAVIGATQLLGMGAPLNERQEQLVSVLKDSANAMMALLNDFLDLSKIETGNLQFENVQFDARDVVAEVVQILEVQAQTKGLAFDQINDCACITERLFLGDPARIRQLLLNLCGNAVKFTEKGAISVEISCQPTKIEMVEDLIFVIRDTGIGIPADKISAIFGKFEQCDSTVTRKYGGTGLGLAIVRALVDAMGGTIDVESELAKGSVFTVRIPLRRVPSIPQAANDGDLEVPSVVVAPRILLVEDTPANVYIAERFMDTFGFEHEVSTDGRQALDRIVAGETYDAILMDIQMPVMDGREATRRIRDFERETGRTPHQIIAMTAHAMLADRNQYLEAGMDDYLAKPFEAKALEQKLVRAIASRRKAEDRFLGEVQDIEEETSMDAIGDDIAVDGSQS